MNRRAGYSVCICWLAATAVLATLAGCEISRVASGDLFLLAADHEDPPSASERSDARLSAQQWQHAAIGCVLLAGVLSYLLVTRQTDRRTVSRPLVCLFLIATALDLYSTVWFFHLSGIEAELHPGVRLLGYAYGRTAGPTLGKALQAGGILLIAGTRPRLATPLLVATSVVYTAAAAYNVLVP